MTMVRLEEVLVDTDGELEKILISISSISFQKSQDLGQRE